MGNNTARFEAIQDQIRDMVGEIISQGLANKGYEAEKVGGWCEDLIHDVLRPLGQEHFQPFKYVVTCLIISKQPNGFHTVTHALWDPERDGRTVAEWENESMKCIITVYGVRY
jgi:dynein light chain Tctex-type 1